MRRFSRMTFFAAFVLAMAFGAGVSVAGDAAVDLADLRAAAEQGDASATKNRDIVAGKMTREQIAEAQRLAREWTLKPE